MRMNMLYVHSAEIGYGRLGVNLAAAVARAGVNVFDDLPSEMSDQKNYLPHGDKSAVCGHVSWISTPGHARGWWKGQSKSLLSMWESSHLPEPFRESLDQFDTIIVPSEQNQELFSHYHPNVKYVPLGIDPDEWHYRERPGLDLTHFTFLISGGGTRKGSDLVIDAFKKVFDTWPAHMPIPRLIVHSAKASIKNFDDDRIHVISGFLSAEEEKEMYGIAHVYVQPSRGEGFGLRPLQAIAQGIPTIATAAHGHGAFVHLMTHPIGWDLIETPPQSFHHGPAGSWWEPNFDELCEAMEDAYLNYESYLPVAKENAERAIREFNWDTCAQNYLDAIGRENLELPDVEPIEWIKPTIRRYLVRVNSHRLFEVGGTQYYMEPGKDYWEPADVKRVLFDSGVIDPSCLPHASNFQTMNEFLALGADIGLTPEQVETIPDYTASHSLCPTCSQKLNTNRPTFEELETMPMPVER